MSHGKINFLFLKWPVAFLESIFRKLAPFSNNHPGLLSVCPDVNSCLD